MSRHSTNPYVIAGFLLMASGGYLLLEAFVNSSLIEGLLGASIAVAGWLLRRRGMVAQTCLKFSIRSLALGLSAILFTYVLAYLALMDRTRPTCPTGEYYRYFESSLRMVTNVKGRFGEPTPYPNVTIFNLLFRPADRLYFKLFPRTDAEVERLRKLGYYQ